MDDYENDGRDYNENIDEGSIDIETEFNFFSKKSNTNESKSVETKKCKPCDCNNGKKRKSQRKNCTNDRNDTNRTPIGNDKKNSEISGKKGRRGRKKKERRLVNPFIIFYLEMYYKNPSKCVAEIATEAGKVWSKMPAKEKEEYIIKARLASAKSKTEKLQNKKIEKNKISKQIRKKY